MGAWRFLRVNFGERLFDRFPFQGIHRQSAASPATGSHAAATIWSRDKLLAAAFETKCTRCRMTNERMTTSR